MARRASFINETRQNDENPLFVLDAGNSLAGNLISLESKGGVIVEGMNAMGYDALTLGRMEFALGLETLEGIKESADFVLLSANVVEKDSQDLIFEPYTVLKRQGITAGIVGLSEADVKAAGETEEKVQVLDPSETAQRYVDELRDQIDVLIILSHLGFDEDKMLAEKVPGIDIIVGGNTRKLMREPERVGNTLIVQQGYSGEWIGHLKVDFDAQGNLVDGEIDAVALDDSYPDDADMMEILEKWKALHPSPTPRPTNTPAR
ncbi:MAG: bifunctional metallophosphatase/5'-nucleotidase [Anaerolineales bacterium]